MVRYVYRYEVPVNGGVTKVEMTTDDILSVATTGGGDTVEFWAEHVEDGTKPTKRYFQAFGTGHRLPTGARWVGTAPRTVGGLVWHLYEINF